MHYYPNEELASIHFTHEDAQVHMDIHECSWNDSNLGICQIFKHFSIFIGSCAWVDHYMVRDVIEALVYIGKFMQWKKLYYALWKIILRLTRVVLGVRWVWTISLWNCILELPVGKQRIGVIMHASRNLCEKCQLKRTKWF